MVKDDRRSRGGSLSDRRRLRPHLKDLDAQAGFALDGDVGVAGVEHALVVVAPHHGHLAAAVQPQHRHHVQLTLLLWQYSGPLFAASQELFLCYHFCIPKMFSFAVFGSFYSHLFRDKRVSASPLVLAAEFSV